MSSPKDSPGPLFSVLEYAPGYVVYALHWPYSVWLALKHGSPLLLTIANPTIWTGGLVNESKADLFALAGPHARAYFAPMTTVLASANSEVVRAALSSSGISYPLVAKPDIGRNGRGVKIVPDEASLMQHLALFPKTARVALQRYIREEGEAGVFYVRKPSEETGRITSLTLKYFPSVIGDGVSTLRQLIERDTRASHIKNIYFRRNARELDRVIAAGERYRIVSVGNHVRGSLFEDGEAHITPEMTAAFDRIAKDIKGFYFGRFDVRFGELDDLKRGKNFSIIEYNGASSEPTHVWDRRTSIAKTYRDMLAHWRMGIEVGAEHFAHGVAPIPLLTIFKELRSENKLIEQYPDEE